MADIFDLGEYALRRAARKGSEHWTGEDGIDWAAETTGLLERQTGADRAGRVDIRGEGADRVPADAVDARPGLASGDPAGRAGALDLLGSDGTAAEEHAEPPEVTPVTVRIGSLFAGIGGFELGMEAALSSAGIPHRTAWQVEQDEYRQQVLARHWPEAKRYCDVRDVGAHNLSPVDIASGQGSHAKTSLRPAIGPVWRVKDPASFFEVVRICREMAPRIVCLENVAAHPSSGT